ncbi:Squalene synthetase [Hordeum vulgare]|nr:Squalene synthetase [Hordeum vulgare]
MGLLSRSEEVAVLVRLKVAAGPIRREIPPEMHWAFAYEMLQRVSCSLALGPEVRNAPLIFTLPAGVRLLPRARSGSDSAIKSFAPAAETWM